MRTNEERASLENVQRALNKTGTATQATTAYFSFGYFSYFDNEFGVNIICKIYTEGYLIRHNQNQHQPHVKYLLFLLFRYGRFLANISSRQDWKVS